MLLKKKNGVQIWVSEFVPPNILDNNLASSICELCWTARIVGIYRSVDSEPCFPVCNTRTCDNAMWEWMKNRIKDNPNRCTLQKVVGNGCTLQIGLVGNGNSSISIFRTGMHALRQLPLHGTVCSNTNSDIPGNTQSNGSCSKDIVVPSFSVTLLTDTFDTHMSTTVTSSVHLFLDRWYSKEGLNSWREQR